MKKRTIALVLVWTVPSAVFLLITAIVYHAYRIPAPERLSDAERAAVFAPLRAALLDQQPSPSTVTRLPGPVAVTLWLDGRAAVRVDGHGDTLAAAVDSAAASLRTHTAVRRLDALGIARARLQVDVIIGRAPIGNAHWLGRFALPFIGDALAVNPGIEGIGAEVAGKTALLLPHELVASRLLSTNRPAEALPEPGNRVAVSVSSGIAPAWPRWCPLPDVVIGRKPAASSSVEPDASPSRYCRVGRSARTAAR